MEGEERREEGGFYGVESFPDPNYGDRSPPPLTLKYPVSQIMFPSVCETKDKVSASLTKARILANLEAINSPLLDPPPPSNCSGSIIWLHSGCYSGGGADDA